MIFAGLFFLTKRKTINAEKYNVYSSIATNFLYPAVTPSSEIRFFTGSAVASFDMSSQTSKSITKDFPIPDALDVRWNTAADKLLIKTVRPGATSSLFEEVDITNPDTWWVFSVSDEKVSAARCSEQGAVVRGGGWSEQGDLILLCSKTNGMQVSVSETNHREILAQQPSVYNFIYADSNQSYIIEGNTLRRIGVTTQSSEEKASNVVSASVVAGKLYYSSRTTEETKNKEPQRGAILYSMELTDKAKPKSYEGGVLAGNIPLLQNTIQTIGFIKNTASPERFALFAKDGESTLVQLLGDDRVLSSGIRAIIPSGQRLLVSTDDGQLFVAAKSDSEVADIKDLPVVVFETDEVPIPNGVLRYDPVASRATITVNGAESEGVYADTNTAIKQAGGDPNQVYKQWVFKN